MSPGRAGRHGSCKLADIGSRYTANVTVEVIDCCNYLAMVVYFCERSSLLYNVVNFLLLPIQGFFII